MQEFWDNSAEHRDDFRNFIHGRKQSYSNGTRRYSVGFLDDQPFCFAMTDEIKAEEENILHKEFVSIAGTTIGLDFGIGAKGFLGKGLAAPTLRALVDFYRREVDTKADTFFIDPDDKNPRAAHVYEKAGFKDVGVFKPDKGAFVGQKTLLMVLKF